MKKIHFLYFGSIRTSLVGPAIYLRKLFTQKNSFGDIEYRFFDREGEFNGNLKDSNDKGSRLNKIRRLFQICSQKSISIAYLDYKLRFQKNAKQAIKKYQGYDIPDTIYCADLFSFHLLCQNNKFESVAKVVCLHDSGVFGKMILDRYKKSDLLSRIIVKPLVKSIKKADKILVLSESAKINFNKSTNFLFSEKVRVLYNGIEDPKDKKSIETIKSDSYFVTIGTLCHRKGQDILVNAINKLSPKELKGTRFYLIGDGPSEESLRKLIHKKSLLDVIILVGRKNNEETQMLLKNSLGLILPSRDEGMPIVILEAMRQKKIVIASNIAAIPEMIDDQINGFITDSTNPIALADTIKGVIAMSEKEREITGNNAYEKFKKYFTIDTHIEILNKYLTE